MALETGIKARIKGKEISYWNCAGDLVDEYYLLIDIDGNTYRERVSEEVYNRVKLEQQINLSIVLDNES